MLEFNPKAKKTILLETLLGNIFPYCLQAEIVGSRSLPNGAKVDSDYDVLVLIPVRTRVVFPLLKENGWLRIDYGNFPYLYIFVKYVNGVKVDLLLAETESLFFRAKRSNDVCRALNIVDKEQRISVWNIVLNNETPVASHKGFSYSCTDPYFEKRIDDLFKQHDPAALQPKTRSKDFLSALGAFPFPIEETSSPLNANQDAASSASPTE